MNRIEKFKGYTNNAGDYQNDKKCLQREEIASMKQEQDALKGNIQRIRKLSYIQNDSRNNWETPTEGLKDKVEEILHLEEKENEVENRRERKIKPQRNHSRKSNM